MIIYVDIDGTICETQGSDYRDAKPKKEQIYKINKITDSIELGFILIIFCTHSF